MRGPRASMCLWEQFPPTIWCLWLGQASEEENQCHPPWRRSWEKTIWVLGDTMAKLGWLGVTALEAWLHQSMELARDWVWGSRREGPGPYSATEVGEGGPGWISPISLLQPPRGSFLKHMLGKRDNVAQINALDLYWSGCWEQGNRGVAAGPPLPGSGSSGVAAPLHSPPPLL